MGSTQLLFNQSSKTKQLASWELDGLYMLSCSEHVVTQVKVFLASFHFVPLGIVAMLGSIRHCTVPYRTVPVEGIVYVPQYVLFSSLPYLFLITVQCLPPTNTKLPQLSKVGTSFQ